MDTDELLLHCFRHFAHLDHSNAAVHCSAVRYSPITFRLAETIEDRGLYESEPLVDAVLGHAGAYAEDKGR